MSTETGRQAEQALVSFLQRQGFKILHQNWRTRWCEIDVIAQKGGTIYFVEVKYRATNRQGAGLDYITPRKYQQMQFAAEFWLSRYGRDSFEYRLAAAEVSGQAFEVTAWLDDL